MRRSWSFFLPLIVVAVTVSSAAGADEPYYYLSPAQIDLVRVVPPPPTPGSVAQKRDVQAVLDAQNARTEASIRKALGDDPKVVFRFADVLGPNFRADNLPFTAVFFQRISSDGDAANNVIKAHHRRPRPFVVNPAITKGVEESTPTSYPTSHATFSYNVAILLAAMVPEKAAALFERAADYSWNRVILGVHFPSDIAGGRIAGSVIANVLLHDARFLADFERAKAEVRRALGL